MYGGKFLLFLSLISCVFANEIIFATYKEYERNTIERNTCFAKYCILNFVKPCFALKIYALHAVLNYHQMSEGSHGVFLSSIIEDTHK